MRLLHFHILGVHVWHPHIIVVVNSAGKNVKQLRCCQTLPTSSQQQYFGFRIEQFSHGTSRRWKSLCQISKEFSWRPAEGICIQRVSAHFCTYCPHSGKVPSQHFQCAFLIRQTCLQMVPGRFLSLQPRQHVWSQIWLKTFPVKM